MLIARHFVKVTEDEQQKIKVYVGSPDGDDFRLSDTIILDEEPDVLGTIFSFMVKAQYIDAHLEAFKDKFSAQFEATNKINENDIVGFLMDRGLYIPRVLKVGNV